MKSHVPPSLALALLLVVSPLGAQEVGPPPQQPAVPDSVQELVQAFQAARQQVSMAQDSALRANPGLVEAQRDVQAFVQEKMLEEEPGLEQDVARMDSLQREAAQAQASQDTVRLRAIVAEGTRIQQDIQSAQAAAMEREDVQARVTAFEERMVAAMAAIDPDIPDALVRLEELAGRLQSLQRGG